MYRKLLPTLPAVAFATVVVAAAAILPASADDTILIDAAGRSLDFNSHPEDIVDIAVSGQHRYSSVLQADDYTIDAVVTVVEAENSRTSTASGRLSGVCTPYDPSSAPQRDRLLRTDIEPMGEGEGVSLLKYRIEFLTSSDQPVVLKNLVLNAYDIDGVQFLEVEDVKDYSLSTGSILTPSSTPSGALRFDADGTSTTTSEPARTAYTLGRAEVTFNPVSEVLLTFGDPEGTSSYEFDFSAGFSWESNGVDLKEPATPPVTEPPVTTPPTTEPPVPTIPPTTEPPVPTTPPVTTPPTTEPPVPTTLPTTTVPAPVPTGNGRLPDLDPGVAQVFENGAPVEMTRRVIDQTRLVLASTGFELTLAGDCSDGAECRIQTDAAGREVVVLDRSGDAVTSGFGFQPGSLVHVWLFSEPTYLGALMVAADGTFSGSFDLSNTPTGEHTLQVNGISADGATRTANIGVVVTESPDTPDKLPYTGGSTRVLGPAALVLTAGLALVLATRRRRTAA